MNDSVQMFGMKNMLYVAELLLIISGLLKTVLYYIMSIDPGIMGVLAFGRI